MRSSMPRLPAGWSMDLVWKVGSNQLRRWRSLLQDVYGNALMESKREAGSQVVRLLLSPARNRNHCCSRNVAVRSASEQISGHFQLYNRGVGGVEIEVIGCGGWI
jgi:hypothetical protein